MAILEPPAWGGTGDGWIRNGRGASLEERERVFVGLLSHALRWPDQKVPGEPGSVEWINQLAAWLELSEEQKKAWTRHAAGVAMSISDEEVERSIESEAT